MKKPGKPVSGRKRYLSDDDETLWSDTARTLAPLKKAKSRVHAATEALEQALRAEASAASGQTPHGATQALNRAANFGPNVHGDAPLLNRAAPLLDRAAPLLDRAAPVEFSSKPPPLSEFDKRKARKLGAGQIALDARIDLHGMRQAEAHAALRQFLFSAYQHGHRWVLVITGKGARQTRERDEEAWHISPVEPGVLRRNVPGWLGEPELRALVVSFKTAAARHGGEGALYVQLRNPDRAQR